jgi:hypothetical protein
MASTKRFMTGGGFPGPGSPPRQIEFTLSYGRSKLYDPNAGAESGNAFGHRIEFSDPEDPAYVWAMYGPPRDEAGLVAFKKALADAHAEVARDPAYTRMLVPPMGFNSWTPDDQADEDIETGRVARSCLWARQFAPGTNVSIDLPRGADANAYRVQARDGDNRLLAEHSGFADPSPTAAGFDTAGLPSWMRNALAYRPQGEPVGGDSSGDDGPASEDPRNIRVSPPYRQAVARQTLASDLLKF